MRPQVMSAIEREANREFGRRGYPKRHVIVNGANVFAPNKKQNNN